MSARFGTVGVVGGGLAGIAAALNCADAGLEVRLWERRPWLGGLTHSFRRGQLWVDNGQHVFLRCCEAYRRLLGRLGVAGSVSLQPRLDIPVRDVRSGRTVRLRRNLLPAPLHLGGSLLRYSPLNPAERLSAVRAALGLRQVDPADPASDGRTFGTWLAEHGQSDNAIRHLWDLIGTATLNARAHQASLALAATVFQVGLLSETGAADLGWSLAPLGQLHGQAAGAALQHAGAAVHTSTTVTAVHPVERGWRVVTQGESQVVEHLVVAVPPPVSERLLPRESLPLPPGWSGRLGESPIVNVHVIYDRRVMREDFLAGVGTPVQWVFDRTTQSGLTEGQYIALSLSAADDLVDEPTPVLRDRLLPAVEALLPAARTAAVRDFFVTRERQATFRPAPGTAAMRPGTSAALPGLYLAGAWTATGWPATMEGAVRSGEAAAAAIRGVYRAARVEVSA